MASIIIRCMCIPVTAASVFQAPAEGSDLAGRCCEAEAVAEIARLPQAVARDERLFDIAPGGTVKSTNCVESAL
jgi:hypothetical protein